MAIAVDEKPMETVTHLSPAPLPVGTQLGVYQLKKVLRVTWFGVQYLAWNHHLKTSALIAEYLPRPLSQRTASALHVRPRSADHEADFRYGLDHFLEESEMLVEIEHPHVIRTDSALHIHGTVYRVSEDIEGRDLASICDNQASSMQEHNLHAMALQLLEGLIQVHNKGYVHGALSPATIMRRANGDAVLHDFAWSRLALAARLRTLPELLHDGYAAPEQYNASGPPGASADLYALGATLYRCITGGAPVPALRRRAARQSGTEDPQPKVTLDAPSLKYSPALLQSIDAMLALESTDRPASAEDVHNSLTRAVAPAAAPEEENVATAASSRTSAGRRRRWALAGGIAVAGLAIIALLLRPTDQTELALASLDKAKPEEPARRSPEETIEHAPQAAAPAKPRVTQDSMPLNVGAKSDAQVTAAADARSSAKTHGTTPPAATTGSEEQAGAFASLKTLPVPPTPPAPHLPQSPSPETKKPSVASEENAGSSALISDGSEASVPIAEPKRDELDIARHVATAEAHITALRLTTPPGENAYEHLKAIETLAPGHPKVREGVERIVTRYASLIRNALAEGRFDRARVYLGRAERVAPAAPVLKELTQALREVER